MFNTRAAMGWDVPFVGHPSMASGELAGLVEKPANWKKVYAIGYKSCSYDAAGKLPPKSEELVAASHQGQGRAQRHAAVVGRRRHRRGRTDRQGGRGKRHRPTAPAIIAYWNTLSKYPGYFGNYSFTPTQHNGYPTEEIVMSEASTAQERHLRAGAGLHVSDGREGVSRCSPRSSPPGLAVGAIYALDRRHLQHDVLDLAGDELHRRASLACSAACSGRCSCCSSACRCSPAFVLTLAAAPSSASSPNSSRCGRC